MRILLLAPHPFYQERGTPIDVLLVLRVLAERPDTSVDLVTYHEGDDVELNNVRMFRIRAPRLVAGVRPGFSFKKLFCDLLLFFKAWMMVHRNRYDLIHADEEAVFFALFFKRVYGVPYAYDLDSSIAQQLVESRPRLRWLARIFDALEARAIRGALVNLPVCVELAKLCERVGSGCTSVLHDISQLKPVAARRSSRLKQELGVGGTLLLYAGNLEAYQGVDLMLEAFSLALGGAPGIFLAIIGGADADIRFYTRRARDLGIASSVCFMGRRSFDRLAEYLADADVLISPRIRGVNTPMKVFSYLHSGKPVIATDIVTHNQILTSREAMLVPPTPQGMAEGILRLVRDESLRGELGERGRAMVERNHTYAAHRKRLNDVYDWIEQQLHTSAQDSNSKRANMQAPEDSAC